MGRYKIMLVDDEAEVRESIIKKIDWEKAGFELIGDAENGEDAMEKLESGVPDVVMTDIRMPYMDGLTLATKLRQNYPSVKVVIFSGYDDFEYAKKAISLNVKEYILKPIDAAELMELLKRLKEGLDKEIEDRRDIARLREKYIAGIPIMREHFLVDLAEGKLSMEGNWKEHGKEFGIDILDAAGWLTAVFHVDADEQEREEDPLRRQKELIPVSVRQIVKEQLQGHCRFSMFNYSQELALIAAMEPEFGKAELARRLELACGECKRILKVTVTAGIGFECRSLPKLDRSFYSAKDAVGYRAIVGTGGAILISDVEPVSRGKLLLEQRDEAALVAAIKFGSEDQIRQAAETVAGRLDEKVHMREYQAYVLSAAGVIVQLIQQYDLNLAEIFGAGTDYFETLSRLESRREFYCWLLTASLRINEHLGRERNHAVDQLVGEAKKFIEENYGDPSLTVEMLCRHLHMNAAYFSTVFKRETGKTCIAYLTEVRLNHAVELLNRTDDKTYIIAAKVGYPEQNYFSYVFKKRFGVSPTKYRGRK